LYSTMSGVVLSAALVQ